MFARASDALTRAPPARARVERCVTMRNRILFERAEIDARSRTVTLRADDARATHAREVLEARRRRPRARGNDRRRRVRGDDRDDGRR